MHYNFGPQPLLGTNRIVRFCSKSIVRFRLDCWKTSWDAFQPPVPCELLSWAKSWSCHITEESIICYSSRKER